MGKVVFKDKAPFYFWLGRPEKYDGREIVRGVRALRYELF